MPRTSEPRMSAGLARVPDDAVPGELAEAFGAEALAGEVAIWATLRPEARSVALRRLAAVRAWDADATVGTAEAIASSLEMSRSRFYRMMSDWRSRPSLAALGVRAGAAASRSERRDYAGANEVLQRLVVAVVAEAADRDVAVSELARRLHAAAGREIAKVPKVTTLRPIVERELVRRTAEVSAGNDIVFDLCPVGIPDADGAPHVMFACIDAGTSVILGVGIGTVDASRMGYRAAAEDALARIGASADGLAWAPRFARSQVSMGSDVGEWEGFFATASRGTGGNVQPKGGGERFGRDIRRLVGPKLGSIRLMTMAEGGEARMTVSTTASRFTREQARLRLEPEVLRHNADVLAGIEHGQGTSVPTPGAMALLRLMSS